MHYEDTKKWNILSFMITNISPSLHDTERMENL